MKRRRYNAGFTLVEMLIVVAVIAILAAMVVGLAARIGNKAKEQFAESTIAILTAALEQFHDYGYRYSHSDYAEFDFPLDCNDFSVSLLQKTLGEAIGEPTLVIIASNHDPSYSGSEALYFFLSRVPECKNVLDKINSSLITNENANGNKMEVEIRGARYPLLRIVDPWRERGTTTKVGKTLRYDYYNAKTKTKRNFPVITSAGPDGIFDTSDDISSR